jgi:protease-4
MKTLKTSLALFLLVTLSLSAQTKSFMTYYDMKDFQQTSPGAFKFGLYGFDNPALTSYLHDADILFTLSGQKENPTKFKRWGIFTGSPFSGFGFLVNNDSAYSIVDYRYSFAFGNRNLSFGFGYGFVGGDKGHFGRSNTLQFGILSRPMPNLSLGYSFTYGMDKGDNESVVELAVRPIWSYPLAVFGDFAWFDNQGLKDGNWSAGISWEVVDGIRINGRYFKDKSISLGLDFSFGHYGVTSQSYFDDNQKYDFNSYSFRVGALDRTIIDIINPPKNFSVLDLNGDIKYRRFILFDDSKTLLDIITQIDCAEKDKDIIGLVVNCTGFNASKALMWEIRDKLADFKKSGKKVVVYIDRADIETYQLASVADVIVMDKLGTITLNGYAIGKSYYKKMLDNLGIGFEELRYFKYKSAAETFARDRMSEGDREQLQKLIDDWYNNSRSEIMAARKLSADEFDKLSNEMLMINPEDALKYKLIDTLGRWTDFKEFISNRFSECSGFSNASDYTYTEASGLFASMQTQEKRIDIKPFDDRWSSKKRTIAVVYALGSCDMETGIKARMLSEYLEKAYKNNSIDAIVLRVDSPGGDGLASDYVSEVIRKNKGKKPLIVSQGYLAASGGYWISMEADTILATPMTITGSIGVIGAYAYDKGLQDTLGIHTDILKTTKFSDLGYPFKLPILGLGLPVRSMNDEEREQIKKNILSFYDLFVDKVAAARGESKENIGKVAQGRVWSGAEGKKNKLVDEIGGLDLAIKIAKEKAGISKEEDVALIEFPRPGLFDLGIFGSTIFGFDVKKTVENYDDLLLRLKNNGIAMPVLPLEYYDLYNQNYE